MNDNITRLYEHRNSVGLNYPIVRNIKHICVGLFGATIELNDGTELRITADRHERVYLTDKTEKVVLN